MRSRWTPWLPIVLAVVVVLGVPAISPSAAGAGASGGGAISAPSLPPAAPAPAVPTVPSGPVQVAPAFVPAAGMAEVGPTPPSTVLTVAVGLPSVDPTGLAAYVAATAVAGSTTYRQFLTPAAADARFGAAPAAVAAARAYFAGYGLATAVNPDGLIVSVTGSTSALADAFHTEFVTYSRTSGSTFISHPEPASLPGSLSTIGVFGLGDVDPLLPSADPVVATGPSVGCAGPSGGLAPCAIASAYDLTSLEENGTNGSGERIAVVDAYAGSEGQSALSSDLATFAGDSGLAVGNVQYLYPVPTSANLNTSGTNSGWALEDALDLEWARAAAPGAAIEMTFSPDPDAGLYTAIDWLVAHDAADVVSMSWGEPDTGTYNAFSTPCTTECNATSDGSYEVLGPVLELGAAEGISFFAASGDCGSADGTSGVATNFPASDPYVTGVGGTDLVLGANDSWSGESGWSGNASGASAPGCVNQGGSGGGFSPLPEPWWQAGIPDPTDHRGVPDVSMDAANPVAIVVDGAGEGVDGTSVGTPIWAGIAAIADQYAGKDLGLLDPGLYALARGSDYSDDFHDVLTGNNGYSAGTGWDPVTGLGTPIGAALVPALAAGGGLAGNGLIANVFATPRAGHLPLTITVAMNATGGTGTYPLEGISFGDGTSALWTGTPLTHNYTAAGGYLVQSFVADRSGNTSTSLPVLVSAGGVPLTVNLSASSDAVGVGVPVTFTTTVSGGVAPYAFTYYFGDGAKAPGAASAPYAYPVAGGFCAEAIATDSADPLDAGVSERVGIAVGGAAAPNCSDGSSPLTVTPNATTRVLDAPADFGSSLFAVSGGSGGPLGLGPSTAVVANDSYIGACGCTIFRHPGNYSVTEWANDSVDGSAEASENITVGPALQATFAASTLYGYVPLKVYFFASVKGGTNADANDTRWTFGNGGVATGHSVSTTYDAPGEYTAIGQISDAGEGNGSEAFLIDVAPVVPSFPLGVTGTMTPAVNVSSGTTVHLTATPVGPGSEVATSVVLWDLGDGRSAFGNSVAETYYAPETGLGNNTLFGEITIETAYLSPLLTTGFHVGPFFAVEPGGLVPAADALVGTTAVTPTTNLVPFPIFGNGTATGPKPLFVSWNFGDGSSEDGPQVEHTLYAAQGYTIETLVSDGWGDGAMLDTAINANGPLGVAGSPTPASGPKPLTVTIAAAAYGGKGPPYRYAWTFENGSHATTSTVRLYFPSIGTYVEALNVTDRSGASAERNFTIVVDYPLPEAPFEIVLGSAGLGAFVAVVVHLGRKRKDKPGSDPWLDHPRTASDGTPVW